MRRFFRIARAATVVAPMFFGCSSGPPAVDPATRLSAGDGRSYVIRASGAVAGWGSGTYLGAADSGNQATPVAVAAPSGTTEVSVGYAHTCILAATGTASCWGLNTYGQIGDGTTGIAAAPAAVVGLTDAVQIAAARSHTCAARASGAVACWGCNVSGELGNASTSSAALPVTVLGLTDALEVATGGDCGNPLGGGHSCARRATGEVVCWGYGQNGQLGDGTLDARRTAPGASVSGLNDAIQISAAAGIAGYTCAVRRTRQVTCWGETPGSADLSSLADAIQVAAGFGHACAVRASGQVACWGSNTLGELGDGTTMARAVPVAVQGLSDAVQVAAGDFHSCALRSGGAVACWGSNRERQLGDGSTADHRTAPAGVVGIP